MFINNLIYLETALSPISSKNEEYEKEILSILHQNLPKTSITSTDLSLQLRKNLNTDISHNDVKKILDKLSSQDLIK